MIQGLIPFMVVVTIFFLMVVVTIFFLVDFGNDSVTDRLNGLLKQKLMIRGLMAFMVVVAIFFLVDFGNDSVTDKMRGIGEAAVDAIGAFEDVRQDLNESLLDMVNEMKERLGNLGRSDEDAIYDIAEEWETFWEGAESDYEDLLVQYDEVCLATDAYFATLDGLTEDMEGAMKRREQVKNERVESKWREEQEEAKASLNALRTLFKKAKQYHNVLLAEALRQQIESNTQEINRIEREAKQLLRRLERFSLSGHRLFGVE